MNFTGATDVYFGGVDVPVVPAMVNAGGTAITVASANVFDMVDAQTATGDMVLNGPISYSYSGGQLDLRSAGPEHRLSDVHGRRFRAASSSGTPPRRPTRRLSWNNVAQDWTGNGDTFSMAAITWGGPPTPPLYLPLDQTNAPTLVGRQSDARPWPRLRHFLRSRRFRWELSGRRNGELHPDLSLKQLQSLRGRLLRRAAAGDRERDGDDSRRTFRTSAGGRFTFGPRRWSRASVRRPDR